MYEKLVNEVRNIMMMDYILSGESERIHNPIRNERRYEAYVNAVKKCRQFAEKYCLKMSYADPEFPKDGYMIELVFQTENDEVEIGKKDLALFEIIAGCDGVNMDTDLKGNIRIYMYYEKIYEERR